MKTRLSVRRSSMIAVTTVALAMVWVSSGCTRGSKGGDSASVSGTRIVRLGIWSNYVTPRTQAEFQKETGIRVEVSNYSSNEELLAKMQAGGGGFDVVVPSDYMVAIMIKLGLLDKLDLSKIPNAKKLESRFLHQAYDPKNGYSLPFDWGTTGIAINRNLYQGKIRGWKDFFTKPDLAGKISLLDDVREVIGAALKAQGYSLNSRDPKELEKAKKLLLASRDRTKLYSSDALLTLTNGEAEVSHAYVSDAMNARSKMNGKVDYILPEEGGTWWIDNLVIPKTAAHVDAAHQLINFLLEPRIVAMTVKAVFVSPTSQAAMALLPADIRQNKAMFPTQKDLAKFEMIRDLGEATQKWDRIWTELKASQ